MQTIWESNRWVFTRQTFIGITALAAVSGIICKILADNANAPIVDVAFGGVGAIAGFLMVLFFCVCGLMYVRDCDRAEGCAAVTWTPFSGQFNTMNWVYLALIGFIGGNITNLHIKYKGGIAGYIGTATIWSYLLLYLFIIVPHVSRNKQFLKKVNDI